MLLDTLKTSIGLQDIHVFQTYTCKRLAKEVIQFNTKNMGSCNSKLH